MLTFSNSGLFYRFLTMLPNQYEPRSVCDLFWRLVLNALVVVGVIAGVILYLVGVYGWFSGAYQSGDKLRVVLSTFSAVFTWGFIVWVWMGWKQKRDEVKRLEWQRANGGDWWDYQSYLGDKRKARKDKLTPFFKKIAYGFEVFFDILTGLYQRVHDKTCVMVQFKGPSDSKAPEADADPFVIDIEDDEPEAVDNPTRVV